MAKLVISLLLALSCFGVAPGGSGVVTLAPGLTDMVIALGEADTLVGVTDYCVMPEGSAAVTVGSALSPSRERIVSLDPAMVFLYREDSDAIKFLSMAGIPYKVFPHYTLEDVYLSLRDMGDYFNKKDDAEKVIDSMKERLENLRADEAATKKRVIVVVGREPGSLKNMYILGRGDFLWEILRLLGCENAYDGPLAYPRMGYESLFSLDPDLIIEILPDLVRSYGADRLLSDWKRASSLRAVRDGKVKTVPPGTRVEPSTAAAGLAETLKEIIDAD